MRLRGIGILYVASVYVCTRACVRVHTCMSICVCFYVWWSRFFNKAETECWQRNRWSYWRPGQIISRPRVPKSFSILCLHHHFFFLRGQYLDLECASKYLTTQIRARHEKEQGIFSRHYPDLPRADSSLGDPRLGHLWASERCPLPVLKEGMEYRVKLTAKKIVLEMVLKKTDSLSGPGQALGWAGWGEGSLNEGRDRRARHCVYGVLRGPWGWQALHWDWLGSVMGPSEPVDCQSLCFLVPLLLPVWLKRFYLPNE